MKRLLQSSTLLWLIAISSCAIGNGLKEVNNIGWGVGLISFGVGLVIYLIMDDR